MSPPSAHNWQEANQRYLVAALNLVRARVEAHLAHKQQAPLPENREAEAEAALQEARAAMSAPSALESLCEKFALSLFEKNLLLLCAGVELDSDFARLCAEAQAEPQRPFATFSLALAALPEAHWSAITPAGALRRWRMIELAAGNALSTSALRIDERVLHYLAGVSHMDERLKGLIETVSASAALSPSHKRLLETPAATWSNATPLSPSPIVQMCGEEANGKRNLATAICEKLGMRLHLMSAHLLPVNAGELEALMRLWEREAVLENAALLLDADEIEAGDAARKNALQRFLEYTLAPLFLISRERRGGLQRQVLSMELSRPTSREQRTLWQSAFNQLAPELAQKSELSKPLEALIAQFSLGPNAIQNAFAQALAKIDEGKPRSARREAHVAALDPNFPKLLWEACRAQARPRLEALAQRITPVAKRDELILPEQQLQILRDITAHVRQRAKVYESWNFLSKGNRGLGISALFAGVSGTGKTMAAEVLAGELQLDLYRIDLSQVVNKYIGETEKNLRRVFDAAEESGAILLFDEADALFGKRSEVKDSHDRYANIEISYLLQRMEEYRGLAILTTNMKNALDTAFMRRIRFTVHFPFPEAAQRAEIWRRIFPSNTPVFGLDFDKLGRLNVTGGNIRNIALNAAFLAADTGEAVGMKHLLRAARSEYVKMEKTLTETEIKDWV